MIITGFQFRAARRALNLHLEQLHRNTGILKGVLTRLENTIGTFENIKCSADDAEILLNYFNQNKLIFPDKNTITLDADIEPKPVENNLTRFQFIVARTGANLSQRELGKTIGLAHGSLQRFEAIGNAFYIKSQKIKISTLISCFNKMGIFFLNNQSVQRTD